LALYLSSQVSLNVSHKKSQNIAKYRKKCFTQAILARLKEICSELAKQSDREVIEFGGESDHIHLLLDMHPNIMPSRYR
jgi:putative transposase